MTKDAECNGFVDCLGNEEDEQYCGLYLVLKLFNYNLIGCVKVVCVFELSGAVRLNSSVKIAHHFSSKNIEVKFSVHNFNFDVKKKKNAADADKWMKHIKILLKNGYSFELKL